MTRITLKTLHSRLPILQQHLNVLAPLMLRDPVHYRISLVTRRGQCAVLFDFKGLRPDVLLPGFALPVLWETDTGSGHDARLPATLRQEADAVLSALALDDATGEAWRLTLAPELGPHLDLSALALSCRSAWTSLAAALIVARRGGESAPHVLGTGSFERSRGVEAVEGIHNKLDTVQTLMERGVFALQDSQKPVVFMPTTQLAEVNGSSYEDVLELHAYPADQKLPEKILAAHLAALDAPPDATAALPERLAWANRTYIAADSSRRGAFYRRALRDDIAQKLKDQEDRPRFDVPPILVAAPSLKNTDLLYLAAQVFEPSKILCVWRPSGDDDKKRSQLNELAVLQNTPHTIEKIPENDPEAMQRWVATLIEKHDDGRTPWVLDITGGDKLMSALMLAVGARLGRAHPVYIEKDSIEAVNQPLFGSERYVSLSSLFSPKPRGT